MYFPSTHWSLLAQASLSGESAGRQALEELCRRYWSPLRQFIQSRGYGENEAEDLTQEFLLHLLEHSTLAKADPLRGRFRSFLLGALTRFLWDQRDRRQAQKRGGGAVHVSLEEAEPQLVDKFDTEGTLFDREWALVILENALRAVAEEFESKHGPKHFAVLRRFLPGSLEAPTYEAAAGLLGVTVPALKTDLHRLRQRFRALVRQEVAATVSAPHEMEEEMIHLQQVLMDRANDIRRAAPPPPGPDFSQ
jgi:RNA polymerase sigma-70 factor (ECF subfamily)